ncbi:MAG: hypothetical protein U0Q07_13965 [Acidimicrobiales bacterium]
MRRWARRGRVGLAVCIVACALVVLAPSAHGCSCAATGARQVFDGAAAVFIGRVVSGGPVNGPVTPRGDLDVEVREVFKGVMGNRISIPAFGSSCPPTMPTDGSVGLFVLTELGGRLTPAGGCGPVLTTAEARALTGTLPQRSGRGEARAVVATPAFGDVSLALVDRDGRPLAYGAGAGDVVALARCRDPNLLVTLSADAASRPDRGVVERWDLTTMRPTEVARVADGAEPASVDCPADGASPRVTSPGVAGPPHLDPEAWQALSPSAAVDLSAGRLPGVDGVPAGGVVGLASPVTVDADHVADPPGTPPPFGGHALPLRVPPTTGGRLAVGLVVSLVALGLVVLAVSLVRRRRSRRAEVVTPAGAAGVSPPP